MGGGGVEMPINTAGRAEVMFIQTLDTGGGDGLCGSPRWRSNFKLLGGALVFVAPISGVELCSRDRVLRTILGLHKKRAYT